MIERAIRASVKELQLASKEGDNNEAIQRAIQASVAEATQARRKDCAKFPYTTLDETGDHKKQLAAALQRGVQENQQADRRYPPADVDFDDSGVDTDDDENIKAAIEASMLKPTGQPSNGKDKDDEDDFRATIELSRKAHEQHVQSLSKSKTEEEIVLEYVKKQSLAEEQLKRSAVSKDQ